MVSKKAWAGALVLMGSALLVMGVWQLNQWYTTQAQASSSLALLSGSLGALGGAGTAGVEAEAARALAGATNAILLAAVLDLVVGLVLLVVGVRAYPDGHA